MSKSLNDWRDAIEEISTTNPAANRNGEVCALASDTPRTDYLYKLQRPAQAMPDSYQNYVGMVGLCRDLERELAAARSQLAEANANAAAVCAQSGRLQSELDAAYKMNKLRELLEGARRDSPIYGDFDLCEYMRKNADAITDLIDAAELITRYHGSAQRAVSKVGMLDILERLKGD